MINLFKVKAKQKENAENASGNPHIKKQSAGELRLHKDITELNLPKSCVISFPNGKDDLMNFEISIRPDEGYYTGGKFLFTFQVSPIYPHEAPKVKCKTKVYHPNIDLEGNVCLNILREDWKPCIYVYHEKGDCLASGGLLSSLHDTQNVALQNDPNSPLWHCKVFTNHLKNNKAKIVPFQNYSMPSSSFLCGKSLLHNSCSI